MATKAQTRKLTVSPLHAPGREPIRLMIGTRILFGDEGEGSIIARKPGMVLLDSPVFSGWVPESSLRDELIPFLIDVRRAAKT